MDSCVDHAFVNQEAQCLALHGGKSFANQAISSFATAIADQKGVVLVFDGQRAAACRSMSVLVF